MYTWASLIAQLVKNLPAMQETPVRFLGLEEPLEKGKVLTLGFPVCIAWAIGFVKCMMTCIPLCGVTQSISWP